MGKKPVDLTQLQKLTCSLAKSRSLANLATLLLVLYRCLFLPL